MKTTTAGIAKALKTMMTDDQVDQMLDILDSVVDGHEAVADDELHPQALLATNRWKLISALRDDFVDSE